MAHYNVTTIYSKVDLKVAVKSEKPLIIVKDEEFFWELEKKLVKNKVARATKKFGTAGIGIGAIGTFFLITPLMFVLLAGILATTLGIATDELKAYDIYFDYDAKSIVLVKKKGRNAVNRKVDTFEGFDLQKFLENAVK